jgi:hypothetical protein
VQGLEQLVPAFAPEMLRQFKCVVLETMVDKEIRIVFVFRGPSRYAIVRVSFVATQIDHWAESIYCD